MSNRLTTVIVLSIVVAAVANGCSKGDTSAGPTAFCVGGQYSCHKNTLRTCDAARTGWVEITNCGEGTRCDAAAASCVPDGTAGAAGSGGAQGGSGGDSGTGGTGQDASAGGSVGDSGTGGAEQDASRGGSGGDSGTGGAEQDASIGGSGGDSGTGGAEDASSQGGTGGNGGQGGDAGTEGGAGSGGTQDGGADAGLACGTSCGMGCLADCGDSVCDPQESCTTCADCTCGSGCGDGVRDPNEQCDDGNQTDDDLCSNGCQATDIRINSASSVAHFDSLEDLGDGSVLASWTTPTHDIRMRRFSYEGIPIDALDLEPQEASAGIQYVHGAAGLGDGSFAISWYSSDPTTTLVGRRFANGCPAPQPLTSESMLGMPPMTYPDDNYQSVAHLGGGRFLVVFSASGVASADSDESAVYLRRYSELGAPLEAGPVLVNSTLAGAQKNATVAALDGGGFAIAWTDAAADGSERGIRARVFTPVGAPVASDFKVNAQGTGDQFMPVATRIPGIGFAVSWTDRSGASSEVRMRRFGPTGIPLDADDIPVNTTTAGYQGAGGIAANMGGQLLITFNSGEGCESGCPDAAVRGRLFDGKTGLPLDPSDSTLNLHGGSNQVHPRPAALPGGDFLVGYQSGTDAWLHRVPAP